MGIDNGMTPPATGSLRRIAILVETSTSWGTQIIAGVSEYARTRRPANRSQSALDGSDGVGWTLYVDARGYFERQLLPAQWEGHGVIARVTSLALAKQVVELGLPCVNVSQIRVPIAPPIQQVTSDQHRIGRLAAEALIQARVTRCGYYGPPKREFYTDGVRTAFTEALLSAGLDAPLVFEPDRVLRSDSDPHDVLHPLIRWLTALGRGAGVLSWNFTGGLRISEACCWAGLHIPGDIAVISGEFDQLISDICEPPLTCIDQSPFQVGYRAAEELDRLMNGASVSDPILVNSSHIRWRSTVPQYGDLLDSTQPDETHQSPEQEPDARGRPDRLVIAAVAELHNRMKSAEALDVSEFSQSLGVSRRTLEVRFKRAFGRGPIAQLQVMRLREAQRLLEQTGLSIQEIAQMAGFPRIESLQRLMRAELAMSPAQYRAARRARTVAHAIGLPTGSSSALRPASTSADETTSDAAT